MGNLLSRFWEDNALPHSFVLAVCLAMLGAGLIMRQPAAGQQGLSIAGMQIPPMCMVKRNFGLSCPGCGLTRSFTASVQGDLRTALDWHRVGPLAAFYVLLQALRHAAWLFWLPWRALDPRWGLYLDRGIWVLLALIPINYVANLCGI